MRRPLNGKRILAVASATRTGLLTRLLRSTGARVVPFPTVRIQAPKERGRLDAALRRWSSYDWVVFTSANGVEAVASSARELHTTLGRPPRIAAVGPATRAAAEAAGFSVDAVPDEFLTDALAGILGPLPGLRILLPRSRIARRSLTDHLLKGGAEVDDVEAYDAIPTATDRPLVRPEGIDLVVFTSGSAVENLTRILPADLLARLRDHATAACIGPVTAKAAERLGFRVAFVAREHTIPGLVRELQEEVRDG